MSGIPLSSKFYKDDKVKYEGRYQCTVLSVDDEEGALRVQIDPIESNGSLGGSEHNLPGKGFRSLPPDQVKYE